MALIGIETWQMWHVREAALRNANVVTASLAESLSQQIENTLKTADTVVATLVQRVEVEGVNPESQQRLYELMTSLASALPAIHEMGLTDKDGNAIVKSLVPHPLGMNYRERDYFLFLSRHNTRDAFIGQPVKSKVDGSVNITVSRRVNAKDGSFAGIVVTSVSMNFFRKLFETVQFKSGGFISLVADNGMLLASSPDSVGDGELAALTATNDRYKELRLHSPAHRTNDTKKGALTVAAIMAMRPITGPPNTSKSLRQFYANPIFALACATAIIRKPLYAGVEAEKTQFYTWLDTLRWPSTEPFLRDAEAQANITPDPLALTPAEISQIDMIALQLVASARCIDLEQRLLDQNPNEEV
jgi:Cache domain